MCQNMGGKIIQTTVSQSYGQFRFSPSHRQHLNKAELNYKSLHLFVACLRLQMNHLSYLVVAECSDTLHTFVYGELKQNHQLYRLQEDRKQHI